MAKFNRIDGLNDLVPLFPLPNAVLFPGVDLSLHLFEPRYREMGRDAMEGSQLVAMANFKPDWEKEYYESPDIHEVVCVGKVALSEELEEGKYNITLMGITRATVVKEDWSRSYRMANLAPLEDEVPITDLDEAYNSCMQVMGLVRRWVNQDQLLNLGLPNVRKDDPESIIVTSYRIASAIKSNLEIKLLLREAESVLQRLDFSRKLLMRDIEASPYRKVSRSFMGRSLN